MVFILYVILCCYGNQSNLTLHKLTCFSVITFLLLGIERQEIHKNGQNVCTLEWKIEIDCHGYFVVMVTGQKSHFIK